MQDQPPPWENARAGNAPEPATICKEATSVPKRDFKKLLKDLYVPPTEPVMVEVPPMNFIMVDGTGDPNTEASYEAAIEALYSVAYTIKFIVKGRSADLDFVVPPLEGLWWAEDMAAFAESDKDAWQWTMMVMMPEPVDRELFAQGGETAREKKRLAAIDEVRFEEFAEGLSAQVMHIGPYAEEAPTIERLHAFIAEQGHERRGKHHEIYLSDPRRTKPEKLKTVIRQPVT